MISRSVRPAARSQPSNLNLMCVLTPLLLLTYLSCGYVTQALQHLILGYQAFFLQLPEQPFFQQQIRLFYHLLMRQQLNL